jgi:glutamyl-tRNA reductase
MLISVGVDYKKTPLELREKLSFDEDRIKNILPEICGRAEINGCVILSTCNRSEIYASATENIDLGRLLLEYTEVDFIELEDKLNTYVGNEAVYHLIETACGINSAIKGESQIITQISRSVDISRECKCTDAELDVLFRTAVTTARKAVNDSVSYRKLSSASKAVERLAELCGGLKGKKCVVIGNGRVGVLAARLLAEKGASVTITLRSYRHGGNIIPKGCGYIDYNKRLEVIDGCDILISATKSPHYTFTSAMAEGIALPEYIVDLAVPRDIEPSVCEGKSTTYFNIDDFVFEDEINEEVYEIVDEGVSEYTAWFNYRESIGYIEGIKEIIAKRVAISTGLDEEAVSVTAARATDMIFGGIKGVITPKVIEECYNKIKERARL